MFKKREGVGWRSPWKLDKLRGGNKNNIIGIQEPLVCLCVFVFFVCTNKALVEFSNTECLYSRYTQNIDKNMHSK